MFAQALICPQRADRVCARQLASLHIAHRGKGDAYLLSPPLQAALGIAQIRVDKGVERLKADELAQAIREVRWGIRTSRAGTAAVRLEGDRLIVSPSREIDPRVLTAAAALNADLAAIDGRVDTEPDPLARMETRRILKRSVFASAVRAAFTFTSQDCAPGEAEAAVAVVGSYNHAPGRGSDHDYLLLYRDRRSLAYSTRALAHLDRIFSLTGVEASNIVSVCSGGRTDALAFDAFDCYGFRLFPHAVVLKMTMSDMTFLEGVGSHRLFEAFQASAARHLATRGNTPMDGAGHARLLRDAERRARGDPRKEARLIEKMIADALCMLKIREGAAVDAWRDYTDLAAFFAAQGVLKPETAARISAAQRVSRVVRECRDGAAAARELGLENLSDVAPLVEEHRAFARRLLRWARAVCNMPEDGLRFQSAVLRLPYFLVGLRRQIWEHGWEVYRSPETGG